MQYSDFVESPDMIPDIISEDTSFWTEIRLRDTDVIVDIVGSVPSKELIDRINELALVIEKDYDSIVSTAARLLTDKDTSPDQLEKLAKLGRIINFRQYTDNNHLPKGYQAVLVEFDESVFDPKVFEKCPIEYNIVAMGYDDCKFNGTFCPAE